MLLQDAAAQGDENQLNARIVAFAAYQQLHQGNVCNAMAIVSKYCPSILQVLARSLHELLVVPFACPSSQSEPLNQLYALRLPGGGWASKPGTDQSQTALLCCQL